VRGGPKAATALLVAALGAEAGAASREQAARPPNILLIYADDLGYGDLASYGHHTLKTPTLDRLASEGLRLTAYYAPSPLCSPSRAGLLTGRTPFRTGIESWIPPQGDVRLGRRDLTLATLLKRRGYQTFMAGKWHLNGGLDVAGHEQPGDHGFDHWLALHAWAIPHQHDPENFFRNGRALGRVRGYPAQIVADEALAWLAERRSEAPFFMYLPFVEPHGTIASPEWFNSLYAAFTRGEPDPFPNLGRPPDNLAARGPGEYYANVTHLDYQIGRVLERLERLGLRDETLVIFTSDNGPVTTDWRHWWEVNLYGSTGGLRGRKADLYEGGIRVPAILRWPGRIAPGRESDTPVIGYDLLPTLAAITGFPVPDDRPIDGEDFSPLLRGQRFERRRPLYWEFDDDQGFHFALRDGDWKLLADAAFARLRLFELAADPFEVVDRSQEQPRVVEALLAKLQPMRASVAQDPLRPGPPRPAH
jgi:arylsulfatase A-like enzyme